MQNTLRFQCIKCNKELNEIEKIGKICNNCLRKEYEASYFKKDNSEILLDIRINQNDITQNIS